MANVATPDLRTAPDRGRRAGTRYAPHRRPVAKTHRRTQERWRLRPAAFACLVSSVPLSAAAEEHAHYFANIPDHVRIVLFALHEDPSVITYAADKFSPEDLNEFAIELCDNVYARVENVEPRLLQRLASRKRAHIFCLAAPK